jgi:ribosomal protein S6--L-glutamate ligase
MKIGILSRGARLYSTARLREAAVRRGHEVRVLDTLGFAMVVEQHRPALLYAGRPLGRYDAVIPRIGASITFFGCAVVRQLEQMGVFTLASAEAIGVARDKLRSIQVLTHHDVAFPATVFLRDAARVGEALAAIGGPPAVIKVLEGTQGVGVILAETAENVQAILETLHLARQNVLIQRFVAECRGRDIRAFVIGDRVVASIRRVARPGEFRANVHRGGRAEAVTLSAAQAATAVRAARSLGLEVAGVDLLEADDGLKVIEVNASPGLEGIEDASGVDVAAAVIEHTERRLARRATSSGPGAARAMRALRRP